MMPFRSLIILAVALLCPHPSSAQISKLPHRAHAEDFFGSAAAISGHEAVVGASGDSECGEHSGAAYIFSREPTTGVWSREQRIVCSDCRSKQFFGQAVAISKGVVVVAAGNEYFARENPNVVHVFERQDNGEWFEVAHVRPSQAVTGTFATDVDIDDGRILVVASGDRISGDPGAAFIFERIDGGDWQETSVVRPVAGARPNADIFGSSGAIHGDRLIIGSPSPPGRRAGAVYIFERTHPSGAWLQRARFAGFSSATITVDIEDDLALVGDHERGGIGGGDARIYRRDATGGWHEIQRLIPSVSSQSGAFGTAVTIEDRRALVVGYDEQLDQAFNIDRVVFVFEKDQVSDRWQQRHVIDIGETEFGASLDSDAGFAIVGSSGDLRPGAAYVVRVH